MLWGNMAIDLKPVKEFITRKSTMQKILIPFLILCLTLIGCSSLSPQPGADQIKADLIGHSIPISASEVWEFAALGEFERFDITGTQKHMNTIEYDISTRLVDLTSNMHFSADIVVKYEYTGGKWKFSSVVEKDFNQVTGGTPL